MARYSVALKSNGFHVDYRSTVSESTGYSFKRSAEDHTKTH